MAAKTHVGIDPGKDGYITVLNPFRGVQFFEMPKIGKEIDLHALWRTLKQIDNESEFPVVAVVEDVHAIYGAAAGSTFEFGWAVGILEAYLVALSIPYTKVQPKAWQKEMFQGIPVQQKASKSGKTMVNNTKLMSEMACKRLFPNEDLRPEGCTDRCKKSHDGKTDSLLIAEYCRRHY